MYKFKYKVPLNGTRMHRDKETNKKLVDDKPATSYGVLPEWSQYAQKPHPDIDTPLMAAIAMNDFIGIDIDDIDIYHELISYIPQEYIGYHAISIDAEGNHIKGGHLLFKYDADTKAVLVSIRKFLKDKFIDVQVDKALIYLATPANETKKLLVDKDTIYYMPKQLLVYLKSLVLEDAIAKSNSASIPVTDLSYYGKLLEDVTTKGFDPKLVKALTPSDYPDVVHPNDVPQGSGTDWMLKIRTKLQRDSTVSPEVFEYTMRAINSMWDEPMDEERLTKDIVRDLQSPQWRYNADWHKHIAVFKTQRGTTIEVVYLPYEDSWILYDQVSLDISKYKTFSAISNAIYALTGIEIRKPILLVRSVKAEEINSPLLRPLLNYSNNNALPKFNTYMPADGVKYITDPKVLSDYREPQLILDFFTNLIPEETTRTLFLRFLARKYITYDYSPIYFVLAGVGGAGKGVLVNRILTYFSGEERMFSTTVQQLENNFNAPLGASDWLEIDEGVEGISKRAVKKLVGTLKRITGSPYISIERKGYDIQTVRHFVTPLLSSNLTTKLITDTKDNDRRLVVIKAPSKMTNLLPYEYRGELVKDTRRFLELLDAELPHFAVYLSQLHAGNPMKDEYTDNTNWKGKDYYEYIESTSSSHDKLLDAISTRNTDTIIETLQLLNVADADIDRLFTASSSRDMIVLWHNTHSKKHGIYTLEDLYTQYPKFRDEDVRTSYMILKDVVSTIIDNKRVKFNGLYTSKPAKKLIPTIDTNIAL